MNKLQNYLSQFKDGKLAICVDSSLAYSALTEILNKYDISLIADSEFPDHLYQRPYVVVDEDACVYSYKNMDEVYCFGNIYDSVDISELECLDMLQDFKDGNLVVQLINSYQYEKFINYLKENDITINSAMEYTQNPSHFPYFYMLRPGVLTAGESYKAIQDYVHINKLVPLGVFMPAFEKTVQKTVEPKVKSQTKQETIPLSVYVQVKSERDITIEQLDALGTSFGEKPELALSRIENNVIDRVFAAIKEKSDVLCDMVRNHYGTPNDIVQDFTESLGSIIDSVRDDLDNDITVEHDLEQDEREI